MKRYYVCLLYSFMSFGAAHNDTLVFFPIITQTYINMVTHNLRRVSYEIDEHRHIMQKLFTLCTDGVQSFGQSKIIPKYEQTLVNIWEHDCLQQLFCNAQHKIENNSSLPDRELAWQAYNLTYIQILHRILAPDGCICKPPHMRSAQHISKSNEHQKLLHLLHLNVVSLIWECDPEIFKLLYRKWVPAIDTYKS